MKKRIICIVLILLFVLLLIPHRAAYTDGGSVGWSAVLWQYTDCYELAEEDGRLGYNVGPRVTLLLDLVVYDGTHFVPAE